MQVTLPLHGAANSLFLAGYTPENDTKPYNKTKMKCTTWHGATRPTAAADLRTELPRNSWTSGSSSSNRNVHDMEERNRAAAHAHPLQPLNQLAVRSVSFLENLLQLFPVGRPGNLRRRGGTFEDKTNNG